MKWISLFENFTPHEGEVEEILEFLKNKFQIKSKNILDKEVKYILVDYKPLYIKGPFSNKKWAINKIFLVISDELVGYQKSSIRKAIRDFINLA
jgi:hypothetical protein